MNCHPERAAFVGEGSERARERNRALRNFHSRQASILNWSYIRESRS